MSGRILRYEVPVDDQPHTITCGPVLHVACRDSIDVVELWAVRQPRRSEQPRTFQVFGTGQPIPDGWEWRGTVVVSSVRLVWHLHEWAAQ